MKTKDISRLARRTIIILLAVCLLGMQGGPSLVEANTSPFQQKLGGSNETKKSFSAKMDVFKKRGKAINLKTLLPAKYRREYVVAQGGATDGKYVYQAFEKHHSHNCIILKYNAKTFEKVKISKPLKIYHANDFTYNPNTRMIYSINCDGKPKGITIIDPKTLTIEGRKTVNVKKIPGVSKKRSRKIKGLASISYNDKRDVFAVRVSKRKEIVLLDESLRPKKLIKLRKSYGRVPQTIETDNKYIYVAVYKPKKRSEILVYNWKGKFKFKVTLKCKYEIENFFKASGAYRATMYRGKWIKKGYNRETYSYSLTR